MKILKLHQDQNHWLRKKIDYELRRKTKELKKRKERNLATNQVEEQIKFLENFIYDVRKQ